nr:MAG TPA: hypothetical protein [Caudoviricetes sp.]
MKIKVFGADIELTRNDLKEYIGIGLTIIAIVLIWKAKFSVI